MNWIKKLFGIKDKVRNSLPMTTPTTTLMSGISIPEPTKSLLWITNEDTSKISSPLSFQITITLTPNGVKTETDDGHNFHGEPSLVWTRLPVQRNTELEKEPMYYPSYSRLSPKHRYQYLNWLQDITQETNLSYVFLYFYGLERHLLVGNYDGAVSEILRLLKCHDKGTFQAYAKQSILVATLYRKRIDVLESNPHLSDGVSNEMLITRQYLGKDLTADEIISLASAVGFSNKRYIKMYPEKFESVLADKLALFNHKQGRLLINTVSINDLKQDSSLAFANMSLPEKVRFVKVPQLLSDERFKSALRGLLEATHEEIKKNK